MKSKIKRHTYILSNLYLLTQVYVLVYIVPVFKSIYDKNIDLPIFTRWIVDCSDHWNIVVPGVFICANLLITIYFEKFAKEEQISKFKTIYVYKIFLYIILFTFLGLTYFLYIPIFTTGPPIR